MKILYITHFDVSDINVCSGTIYHIKKSLEDMGNEIVVIDNLKINNIYKYLKVGIARLAGKKIFLEREPYVLKSFSKQIRKRIKNIEYDVIFAPSSLYYSFYKDKKPMVIYTDACFGGMIDYYIDSNCYYEKSIKNGFNQEYLALKNADLIIYASNWAKQTAIKKHHLDPSKSIVINRGANIKHNYSKDEILNIINQRNISLGNKKCIFMFLGKDWERKGGPLACDIVRILNEKYKIEAYLNVVGCTPKISKEYKKYINVTGFLDKKNKDDYEKLENIFKKSDFFLLPTRKEAQGISYAEACSWGLPVIASNTGGVSDIVSEGVNGLIFQVDDQAEIYAMEIAKYVNDSSLYRNLSKTTYDYFIDKLKWSSVVNRINESLLNQLEGEF